LNYYDDILNVNAYLRSQMKKGVGDMQQLVRAYQQEREAYDALLDRTDALLARAKALAKQAGVKVPQKTSTPVMPVESCEQLLVKLPDDYDFAAAFEKLREEAHAAGFTDVHPEELLTAEEMRHAEAFEEELDARFMLETSLTSTDMRILAVAVALRIACFHLFSAALSAEERGTLPDAVLVQENAAQPSPVPNVNAMEGVNLGTLLNNAEAFTHTISRSEQLISTVSGKKHRAPAIKLQKRILTDRIPFDVPTNSYFRHEDVLGYDPWLGWIFGVINIMTDTVTTKKMHSYVIVQPGSAAQPPKVDQKVSTLIHLFLPVMRNMDKYKTAMLAAVVREAEALKLSKAPAHETCQMLCRVMETEENHQHIIRKTDEALHAFSPKASSVFAAVAKQTATAAFLNQLITAMHAVMYEPERDGAIDMYVIRTNRILTLSSALAATANSLPALITGDIKKLDFGGIITTLLSLFSSTRFWIEIKTNYLVSAYKKEIDQQMAEVNQYFKVVPAQTRATESATVLPPLSDDPQMP